MKSDPLHVGAARNPWLPLSLPSQARNTVNSLEVRGLPAFLIPSSPMLQRLDSRLRVAENSGAAFLHPARTHTWTALAQAQQAENTKAPTVLAPT